MIIYFKQYTYTMDTMIKMKRVDGKRGRPNKDTQMVETTVNRVGRPSITIEGEFKTLSDYLNHVCRSEYECFRGVDFSKHIKVRFMNDDEKKELTRLRKLKYYHTKLFKAKQNSDAQ